MLLSTSAESLFWFARQVERAEALSRALLTYEELGLDMPRSLSPNGEQLLSTLGLSWVTSPSSLSALKPSWVMDAKNPSSVLGALRAARENLRMSRIFLPSQSWEALTALYQALEAATPTMDLAELLASLARVELLCHQLSGLSASSMTRDDAYAFLEIGRHLERADMMLRLVNVTSELVLPDDPRPFDDVRWTGLLKSVGAFEMYRRCHHGRLDLPRILEFLLFNPIFPRSLGYCLDRIESGLIMLPRNQPALSALQGCRLDTARVCGGRSTKTLLGQMSAALLPLAELSSTLERSYFGVSPRSGVEAVQATELPA
jgi:uncharacterized alpha-E superfamily protein